jgi:hypothetical protein
MKRFIHSFPLLILAMVSYGQTTMVAYDSLLIRTIQKQIIFPDSNGIYSTGATIIRVYKNNDSLYLDILYASGTEFNLADDKELRRRFNVHKDRFPNGYSAVVPLYFDMYKEGDEMIPLNIDSSNALQQEIKTIEKKYRVIRPIHISGYPTVH